MIMTQASNDLAIMPLHNIDYAITGKNGDIGTQLFNMIASTDSSVRDYRHLNVESEVDTFIHLAAKHPHDSVKALIDANLVFLTSVLQQSFVKFNKFVYISSTSVYGAKRVGLISENYYGSNMDSYGLTKKLAELLVTESCERSIILRCPAILELGQSKNLLSKLFDACLHNRPIELSNAHAPFNTFVAPQWVLKFIQSLEENRMRGQVVNIAAKPDLSLINIVEIIRDMLKSTSTISLSDRTEPHHLIDTTFAENEFDFRPSSTEQTIKKWCNKRYDTFSY